MNDDVEETMELWKTKIGAWNVLPNTICLLFLDWKCHNGERGEIVASLWEEQEEEDDEQ